MRSRLVGIAVALATIASCGDNLSSSPFDSLPNNGDFTVATLDGEVHVARDKFGIAHVQASSVGDMAFVQGYVMAHDRLPQMDILRRFGAGKLAELFGGLDASTIDTDLEMRVHRMTFYAQQTWDTLNASTDPTDQEIVRMLQRFTDGVNQYAQDLHNGRWTIDPNVAVSFQVDLFVPWTPVDSLVLGRFQAWALSWSTPFETDLTELYQKLRETYVPGATNPQIAARAGMDLDLLTTAPVGDKSTIDGFPNVTTDSGTRSDGGRPGKRGMRHDALHAMVTDTRQKRPHVPQKLFDDARKFTSRDIHNGPFGALGTHAFMRPWAGSNNWAVSPALAGGKALLATDQHLQMPNPSIFYPMHLIITNNDGTNSLDVMGVTFPGIPGIILGTNGNVAWSGTVSEHDVNDVYLEDISPCSGGAGDCVDFNGAQVPLDSFTETIQIGAFGTITDSFDATYEIVPHHGPIIPTIDGTTHTVTPRSGSQALSVRYTGYDATFEIRALYNLVHAGTVDDGFKALKDFSFGSQNWTMIDNSGNIAWTTNAFVPWRSPDTYGWDPVTAPDAPAPFLVLPGNGSTEWEGRMDSRYVPHSINPAQGYLATANADPVGATFDNNALNQDKVDGRPLYVGITYAAGVREQRITDLITEKAAAGGLTLDDMSTIQHDTHSNVGDKMLPALVDAFSALEDPTAPADVVAFNASLSPDDKSLLIDAKMMIEGWSGATPTGLDPDPGLHDGTDSAATAVFNMWMHFFLVDALSDEFTAAGFDIFRLDDNQLVRIVYRLLSQPDTFVQDAVTGQPIVCDDVTKPGDDSCTKVILVAMLDAMHQLQTSFGTANETEWKWGNLHHLTITPLFPNVALNLPNEDDPTPDGFPKAGDNFVVNRADMGWSDTNFSQFADGPAQRFLAEASPGETIKVKWALPGGTIFDSRDPHYRDLLDNYYLPLEHFDAPFSIDEIVGAGESRFEFHP